MSGQKRSLLCGLFASLVISGGCANRPPTLNCAVDQPTVTEGDSVTLRSNASDPDRKDRLTFAWNAARGRLSSENGTAVFDSTGLDPGQYTVSLEVRDRKQNTAQCELGVSVEKRKLAPSVSCEPSSLTVTEGGSTTLTARASDPNGDALDYSWSVDGQRVSQGQPTFDFGTTGRSLGRHTVGVTVTDVDGMTADCDFNVTVDRRPNRNPSVTLALTQDSVYAGETVGAEARATDPDGDPLSYSWSLDGQGRPETSSQIQINTSALAGGRHRVSVTVRDDRQATASDTRVLSVRERIIIQADRIRPDNIAKARLDEIAVKMNQNPQLRALITGHTDDRGSEAANQRVGQRRADAARDYLVREANIPQARIETRSAGESQPRADNATAEGRKENRRVEIELYEP